MTKFLTSIFSDVIHFLEDWGLQYLLAQNCHYWTSCSFSWSPEVFEIFIYLYILTIKAPSALLIKATVVISIWTLPFITHILFWWLHPLFLILPILSLTLIQLILSCVGNQDLLGSKSSCLSGSLMSHPLVLFMPRLASFLWYLSVSFYVLFSHLHSA